MPLARVQFWGTRGSLAKPGPATLRYGGNTSCVQLTSPAGTLVVIDCGTGAHDLGRTLQANATQAPGRALRGHLIISHTHWDHIQGFPFFAPLFLRGGHWDIYGPAGLGKSLRESLAGQLQYTYFPITLEDMAATIRFHDLVEGAFEIDDLRITTRYLNHPVLTLGYRFEMAGATVVYCCDHEPHARLPGQRNPLHDRDRHHAQFIAGADLLIHDAQFTDAEYPARKGWGHSTVEYVVEIAEAAGVKQVALSHHDPTRTDEALDQIVAAARADLAARQSPLQLFAAADGQIVEISASDKSEAAAGACELIGSVRALVAPALRQATVLHGVADRTLALKLAEAIRGEGVQIREVADGKSIVELATTSPSDLIVLEDQLPGLDALTVCHALRAKDDAQLKTVPLVVVAAQERATEGKAAGVTAWLLTPFSTQYARAFLQSWVLRSKCRWARAVPPPNEADRLHSLRSLDILDTPAEDRFERITRLAAALADVPIASVSLVDENRQWLKACIGLEGRETSREVSFCAHVVTDRQALLVPDTFADDRFAENPLVIGAPRIRFYAGFPVFHADGACLGTLCLIDIRPRQFSESQLKLLQDLAGLVEKELNSKPFRGTSKSISLPGATGSDPNR